MIIPLLTIGEGIGAIENKIRQVFNIENSPEHKTSSSLCIVIQKIRSVIFSESMQTTVTCFFPFLLLFIEGLQNVINVEKVAIAFNKL